VTAVAFDTLRFVRTLRDKAKMSSEQAEGLADAIAEAIQNDLATKTDIAGVRTDIEALRLSTKSDIETLRLATKTDIAAVRTDIEALRLATKSDIETLRLATKADLAETKAEIIKWMISSIGFQALVIVGGVVALARGFH
jgi:polyhydroxyalkanoate synthesis regulator phasin